MGKETWKKIEYIVAAVLTLAVLGVCVYQLRFGIDVQDTASYITKFRYFFEKGTGGNALYYLLGEFFGSLVYHVFPTLYALNVAGLIVWALTGMLIYRIIRPYLSTLPLTAAVLGGLGFSASWVRCVNWNAWSMLFLTLGILFLLHGFDTDEKKWFYFAGLILGWNTFTRMPNIIFLGLVVVVFYYYIGEGVKKALANCGRLTAGGAIAGITGCIFSIIFLGMDKFLSDIGWLMGSTGDKESKHNIFDMMAQVMVGAMDGARQWIKYGVIIGAVIVLCLIVKKLWKKDVTLLGAVLAGAVALYIGFTRDVMYSSMPTLISVQNFIAYGGMAFGAFGAVWFNKSDKRFAAICLMEALAMIFMTIGTDTGSIFFRVYMALPAAVMAAILWKLPLKEIRIMAVFIVALTLATGANCNQKFVYHDGEHGEAIDSTIDAPVFEGVYTTASRAEYVNRLIELLAPYETYELLTIGAFNIGHNVTNMKTFFDSAWSDLDYLSMEEFNTVLDEKLAAGNVPVIVIATTNINGAYWVPEKIEILEELVQGDGFECIHSDEWYSVYVPVE